MILAALSLVIFAEKIQAAVPSFGACPENRGLTSFDLSRYTGTWYEYANVFEVFQIGGKCVRATYTDNGDGSVGVFNEQIKRLTGSYGSINGTARLADPGYAEFVVNFDKVPFTTSTPNYRVLDTDYDGYSIVYNCNTILGLFKTESVWYLTRQQTPEQAVIDQGYEKMTTLGLPVNSLKKTTQTGCEGMPAI